MDPQSSTAVQGSSTATVEPASTSASEGQTSSAPAGREGRQEPASATTPGTVSTASTPTQQPGETLEHWRQRAELAEQRHAGLAGVLNAEKQQAQQRQQAIEARVQAAEQRAQRAEAAAWQTHWRLQGLSPEQIRDNVGVLQERQRLQSEQAKLATDRQRMLDEQTAFRRATEGPARQIVAERIAKEEGVPVERIAHLSHPDLMRELAKEIRGLTREGNLQTRRTSGTDKAESGGGGGIDVSKMSAHERIKMGLKQHHAQSARR